MLVILVVALISLRAYAMEGDHVIVSFSNHSNNRVLLFTSQHSGSDPIYLDPYEDSEQFSLRLKDKIYIGLSSGTYELEGVKIPFSNHKKLKVAIELSVINKVVDDIEAIDVLVLIDKSNNIGLIDRSGAVKSVREQAN